MVPVKSRNQYQLSRVYGDKANNVHKGTLLQQLSLLVSRFNAATACVCMLVARRIAVLVCRFGLRPSKSGVVPYVGHERKKLCLGVDIKLAGCVVTGCSHAQSAGGPSASESSCTRAEPSLSIESYAGEQSIYCVHFSWHLGW